MNAPSAPPPAPGFDEMRRILRELPGPDLEAQTEVVRRQAELTKPPGALGRLEELAEWLAAWQGRAQPMPVLARGRLRAGAIVDGPALIAEYSATTLIAPGWRAQVLDAGALSLTARS